jgi:putative membrane protein
MQIAAAVMTGFIAVLHLWFLVLEMFLWNTAFGRKRLKLSVEQAEITAPLAANQGLYNGFLAAGLVWSFFLPPAFAFPVRVFFLGCVGVAGLYGGLTTSRPILYLQALPGLVALGLVWLAG